MNGHVGTGRVVEWEGIEIHVDGPAGAPVIVMIHGWPDTFKIWDAQVADFSKDYQCVRFTLPGYEIGEDRRSFGLDEVTRTIGGVVDAVSPDAPVVVMLHDWGCVFGDAYADVAPERVSAVVMFDVGDANSPELESELSRPSKMMRAGYQGALAAAWRSGGRVGDSVTRTIARALAPHSDISVVHSGMNYPYEVARLSTDPAVVGAILGHPTYFSYGTKKPFMFHSTAWVARLASRSDCQVAPVEAGHWLMVERAREVNADVARWLAPLVPLLG